MAPSLGYIAELPGGNVRFTLLEGYDHDEWTDTFINPEFFDWFLQYQKPF